MLTKDAIVEHYPNGQLEWRIPIEWHEYRNYRFHGEAIQYYSTGEVKLRQTYEHGVAIGEEIMYYRDGSIMSVLRLKNGKKDSYVFNHPDGSREECAYNEGELIKTSIRKFDKNGKEKVKKPDAADGAGQSDPKKILPGDHVPPALLR